MGFVHVQAVQVPLKVFQTAAILEVRHDLCCRQQGHETAYKPAVKPLS